LNLENNICIDLRSKIEKAWEIEKRLECEYIREIKIMGLTATAWLSDEEHFTNSGTHGSIRDQVEELLRTKQIKFSYILPKRGSFSEKEAIRTKKINGSYIEGNAQALMQAMRRNLKKDIEKWGKHKIQAHWTEDAIPYSLVIILHDEKYRAKDCLKIDLYTPYLQDDTQRHSFFIERGEEDGQNDKVFRFFEDSYRNFWDAGTTIASSVKDMVSISAILLLAFGVSHIAGTILEKILGEVAGERLGIFFSIIISVALKLSWDNWLKSRVTMLLKELSIID